MALIETHFPRNELWVRKVYENLVRKGKLTTFFRPGDRILPTQQKYFIQGETLTVRSLEKPGDEERGILPVLSGFHRQARVVSLAKKSIEELSSENFRGSSPDVQNILQLKYNLGLTYDLPTNRIREITRIELEYLK